MKKFIQYIVDKFEDLNEKRKEKFSNLGYNIKHYINYKVTNLVHKIYVIKEVIINFQFTKEYFENQIKPLFKKKRVPKEIVYKFYPKEYLASLTPEQKKELFAKDRRIGLAFLFTALFIFFLWALAYGFYSTRVI